MIKKGTVTWWVYCNHTLSYTVHCLWCRGEDTPNPCGKPEEVLMDGTQGGADGKLIQKNKKHIKTSLLSLTVKGWGRLRETRSYLAMCHDFPFFLLLPPAESKFWPTFSNQGRWGTIFSPMHKTRYGVCGAKAKIPLQLLIHLFVGLPNRFWNDNTNNVNFDLDPPISNYCGVGPPILTWSFLDYTLTWRRLC